MFWADLSPVEGREQGGRRPIVVLSQDVFNERSGTVIAVAVTSNPQRAGFPLTLELTGKKIGKASPEEMGLIVEGLNEIIGR